jgi:quercetin dioxygenase-like cupin family protein
MRYSSVIAFLAGAFALAPSTATAQEALVKSLMSKPLGDIPGKEVLMLSVEYPVGAKDVPHRHHAHGFIYVLEGTIVMQVKGGKETTVHAGETFYEGPNDIHVVGRNASTTQPAKFIVVLLKPQGAPVLVPEQ